MRIVGAQRFRFSGQIVSMIVMVPVDAQRRGPLRTKDAGIFGVLRYMLRFARAADVTVQADNPIAFRHHDVEIVRNE